MVSSLRPFLALSLGLFVSGARLIATESSPESVAADEARASIVEGIKLNIARNGVEVVATWDIPPLEIRGVELLRNTRKEPKGRTRVASVSSRAGQRMDEVPDASAVYWYWLKITLKNGRTVSAGPVPTPTAEVWRPSE